MDSYKMDSYKMDSYKMDSYKMVIQTLDYLYKYPELIEFVKNFNEENGFMWSGDERIFKIFNGINNENHSPTSFALTLRLCQNIYKGQLILEEYHKSCYFIDALVS